MQGCHFIDNSEAKAAWRGSPLTFLCTGVYFKQRILLSHLRQFRSVLEVVMLDLQSNLWCWFRWHSHPCVRMCVFLNWLHALLLLWGWMDWIFHKWQSCTQAPKLKGVNYIQKPVKKATHYLRNCAFWGLWLCNVFHRSQVLFTIWFWFSSVSL